MLGGIYYVMDTLYGSRFALSVAGNIDKNPMNGTGQAPSNYVSSDISTYGNCNMTWEDPTVDIMNTARELMLRSAIAYSAYNKAAMVPQQLYVDRTETMGAYKSHYEYLIITLICMALQALLAAFLLAKWRRLGRDMSLDVFEIARALGSPLLQGTSSNVDIQTGLAPMRHERLRYGEISPRAEEKDIRSAGEKGSSRHTYVSVQQDDAVQTADSGNDYELQAVLEQTPRLGLDLEERVMAIRWGTLY